MSLNLAIGQNVRISSDVIKEGAKDDDLLGELGVPGLFRHLTFEILKLENDATRGAIAICRITNPEILKTVIPGVKEVKYEGELTLLASELVLANTKVTLDYVIETAKSKDQMIKELFVIRKALEARGLDKRNKEMRANWKEIQILRGEVQGAMPAIAGDVTVYLPRQRVRFTLKPNEVPGSDEESIKKFKQLLTNKLRGIRSQRKTKTLETKVVFGMMSVQKSGGVYLQERSLLTAYEEMMKTTLETDKKPIDPKANYVGIEIEFIYSGKYEILKNLLIAAKLHKHITLKGDGSLRSCHNYAGAGLEMNILCKTTEVEDVMKRLDSVFANPEIDGYTNRSCGLHVHVDARNRDVKLMYKNFVRVQSILRGSQPVGRIKNTHCRANTTDKLEDLQSGGSGGGGNRYWVVNGMSYDKHKSIEIRIHEGTVNCEDIYNWVAFLDAVASHKKEIPKNELKFAEDLVAKYDIDIPVNAVDYVDRRIERFNSLSIA